MKFHYYAETDSFYIDFSKHLGMDSCEVSPDIVLDFGAEGQRVGIDIDHASHTVDLSHLEATALPVKTFSLANA